MTTSIWQESMRLGIRIFDDELKAMIDMIELLDVDASHNISNEFFLLRLSALEKSVKALCKHEESLMKKWPIPEHLKVRHMDEHDHLFTLFTNVYFDSMDKKQRNPLGVYHEIRSALEGHLLDTSLHLKPYASST
jgi:hemerythrin